MKIIGLTGGIGSGKSTVANVFASMGAAVYDADREAKQIYETHPEVVADVQRIFGDDVFSHGILDKAKLAALVFRDESALAKLNAIVHPVVKSNFASWLQKQDAPYVIREAAILIESGSNQDCDAIILVSAPEDLRIQRVMKRSGLSEEEVRARMARQWTDEQRRPFCRYEIVNDESELITPVIARLHNEFMV